MNSTCLCAAVVSAALCFNAFPVSAQGPAQAGQVEDHRSICATLPQAVEANDLNAAEPLLQAGQHPDAKNALGFTPLHIAAGLGNLQMVELLLTAGADPNILESRTGTTPLHKAAQNGSVEVARLLVRHGAFIDVQAPTLGNTPLIDATWHKRAAMVQYLLEEGARPELKTRFGRSALDIAKTDLKLNAPGAPEIVAAFEADAAAREAKIKQQRLMAAVIASDVAAVRRLIAEGVPLDEKAPLSGALDDGYTPLLTAAREGHAEIVRLLLQAGADPRLVDDQIKATPGHKAGYQGRAEAMRALVEDGRFEINARGPYNGYTALHDAIWHGHAETARILIEAGARLDLRTHTGHTPLELALDYGYPEIAEMIREKLKTRAQPPSE